MSFSMSLVVRDVNGKAIGRKESKTFEHASELDTWYQKNRWRPKDKKNKKKAKVEDFQVQENEQLKYFSSDMVQTEKIKRKKKRKSESVED